MKTAALPEKTAVVLNCTATGIFDKKIHMEDAVGLAEIKKRLFSTV